MRGYSNSGGSQGAFDTDVERLKCSVSKKQNIYLSLFFVGPLLWSLKSITTNHIL